MSVPRLLQTYEAWKSQGFAMVLATVYETIGSTYSKAGHRILIASNGDYQGLVSGGCLEGDLAEHSHSVLERDEAKAITYDMRGEADEVFGLGVGCNGLLRVFLQPLQPARGYEPFASIAKAMLSHRPAVVATVVESRQAGVKPGGTLIVQEGTREAWSLDASVADTLAAGAARVLRTGETRYVADGSGPGVLYAALTPIPRLLLLGGGLDAVPLANMATDLGWRVTVADHRPAYIARGGFTRVERALHLEDPEQLAERLPLAEFDAIVVMSHHLTTDRTYLSQLADVGARYIGILGPRARKERLLADLGKAGAALAARLKGPVGLDIGADSPESIALSILAEAQATLAGATVKPLTQPAAAVR